MLNWVLRVAGGGGQWGQTAAGRGVHGLAGAALLALAQTVAVAQQPAMPSCSGTDCSNARGWRDPAAIVYNVPAGTSNMNTTSCSAGSPNGGTAANDYADAATPCNGPTTDNPVVLDEATCGTGGYCVLASRGGLAHALLSVGPKYILQGTGDHILTGNGNFLRIPEISARNTYLTGAAGVGGSQIRGGVIQFGDQHSGVRDPVGPHDYLIRHVRFRPDPDLVDGSSVPATAWKPFRVACPPAPAVCPRIILDHVTANWGADDSTWANGVQGTIQWSFFAEGIGCDQLANCACGTCEPDDGEGFAVGASGGDPTDSSRAEAVLSVHHNLFAHYSARTILADIGMIDNRNNVVVNQGFNQDLAAWGTQSAHIYGVPFHFSVTGVNHISNIFKWGPETNRDQATQFSVASQDRDFLYAEGNAQYSPGFTVTGGTCNGDGDGICADQWGQVANGDQGACWDAADYSWNCPGGVCVAGYAQVGLCWYPATCSGGADNGKGCETINVDCRKVSRNYEACYAAASPHPMATVPTQIADNALYQSVLAGAGALPGNRDSVESRIISELGADLTTPATGAYGCNTGATPAECAHPTYTGTDLVDTDRDGMPDAWEGERTGLDPNVWDATADNNSDGYHDLENYLHEPSGDGVTFPASPVTGLPPADTFVGPAQAVKADIDGAICGLAEAPAICNGNCGGSDGDIYCCNHATGLWYLCNEAGGGGDGFPPGGMGSEVQYRVDATTFGGITGSSVSMDGTVAFINFLTGLNSMGQPVTVANPSGVDKVGTLQVHDPTLALFDLAFYSGSTLSNEATADLTSNALRWNLSGNPDKFSFLFPLQAAASDSDPCVWYDDDPAELCYFQDNDCDRTKDAGENCLNVTGGSPPAGTGSELQHRADASTFGAVEGSSTGPNGEVTLAPTDNTGAALTVITGGSPNLMVPATTWQANLRDYLSVGQGESVGGFPPALLYGPGFLAGEWSPFAIYGTGRSNEGIPTVDSSAFYLRDSIVGDCVDGNGCSGGFCDGGTYDNEPCGGLSPAIFRLDSRRFVGVRTHDQVATCISGSDGGQNRNCIISNDPMMLGVVCSADADCDDPGGGGGDGRCSEDWGQIFAGSCSGGYKYLHEGTGNAVIRGRVEFTQPVTMPGQAQAATAPATGADIFVAALEGDRVKAHRSTGDFVYLDLGNPIISPTEPASCVPGEVWHKTITGKGPNNQGYFVFEAGLDTAQACQWYRLRRIQ